MVDDKNKNFEKLVSFLTSSGWDVSKRTGDDSKYEQFLKAFPKTSLEGMSLDQYCVGDGKNTSFCWWIERGLQPAFGRYMPGTSKGHILYKLEDGSIYKNARLKAMPDEAALAYTLKIQQVLVNADDNESLAWIDDDKELFKKAGVQPIVSMGEGRKLRLLSVYRPDTFIPIASSGHIGHFLLKFGVPPENVPSYKRPISRMNALYEIYEAVKDKVSGLSPYVFMKALYEPTLGLKPVKDLEEKASKMSELEETALQQAVTTERSLNTILYGPPGTGKTYATIDEALVILDPGFYASYPDDTGAELEIQEERRRILKARYDQLVEQGHIRFVTFHQSFSYEDFVEGIRALPGEQSGLRFEVVDGVFKELCISAETRTTHTEAPPQDLEQRTVWKMSLGNTQEDESHIYDECIENDCILLGYGGTIDFTMCRTRADIEKKFDEVNRDLASKEYAISVVETFITKVKVGDLVVVTAGNFKFRAIGEVVGDYEFAPREDHTEGFSQKRRVKWLKVFDPALPFGMLLKKQFVQRTLYPIKERILDREKLANLLNSTGEGGPPSAARFLVGEVFNRGYVVKKVTPELLLLEKPNKSLLPFTWDFLGELAALVKSKEVSLEDIKAQAVFSKVPKSTLEKFLVNGYSNILPPLVERMVASNAAPLVEVAKTANGPQRKVLIIDEINRGNISRIFGELITLIEPSKRKGATEWLQVTLPYSKEVFSVPDNVFVVGTMNSADRSLSGLDVALRRRFTFKEMPPRPELLESLDVSGINVGLLLNVINDRIELLLDREHCIGHSYFLPLRERPEISHLADIFRDRILPLLQEYFFDDWERIGWVLNDHREPDKVDRFVVRPEASVVDLFGNSVGSSLSDGRWIVNGEALINPLSYLGVIGEYA